MNEKLKVLTDLVPKAPSCNIDWKKIENSVLDSLISKLKNKPQDKNKKESVWDHIQAVCEELVKLSEYRDLSEEQQQILFIAALLQDMDKVITARPVNRKIKSSKYNPKGSDVVREFLYKTLGLNGNKELIEFRESVCNLIKHRSTPNHIFEKDNPERELLKISANQNLMPNFSIKLLSILEEANMKGSSNKNQLDSANSLKSFRELALQSGCYDKHLTFPDKHSEFMYLNGESINPGESLYDDTWGEIILLSGLPASGKDTYISNLQDNYPIVSLDDIRKEIGVLPTGNQSKVIKTAKERAKELLRNKQPFVWNATNLSPWIRNQQLDMFHKHNASTKIVYLETDFDELIKRNDNRQARVPNKVIGQMLRRLTPPESFEAQDVVWQVS